MHSGTIHTADGAAMHGHLPAGSHVSLDCACACFVVGRGIGIVISKLLFSVALHSETTHCAECNRCEKMKTDRQHSALMDGPLCL